MPTCNLDNQSAPPALRRPDAPQRPCVTSFPSEVTVISAFSNPDLSCPECQSDCQFDYTTISPKPSPVTPESSRTYQDNLQAMLAQNPLQDCRSECSSLPAAWQLCPKCHGQGVVSKPPWIPADQVTWTSSVCTHLCDVCQGQKVLPVGADLFSLSDEWQREANIRYDNECGAAFDNDWDVTQDGSLTEGQDK